MHPSNDRRPSIKTRASLSLPTHRPVLVLRFGGALPRFWAYALAAVLAMMPLAKPASAQQDAVDFARGAMVAEDVCSLCHDVTLDQSDPKEGEAPSFAAIAAEPGQSADRLTGNILFPHRNMPQFSFETKTDLRDVVGYILSMRRGD